VPEACVAAGPVPAGARTLAGVIGRPLAGRAAGEAGLVHCAPTLAAHEVPPHAHEGAHVVAVERGHYLSSAEGLGDATAGAPLLVLNPPGTEHHDRFAPGQVLAEARFFVLEVGWPLWLTLADGADLPARPQAWHGADVARWLQRLQHVLRLPDATPADTEGLAAELAGQAQGRREQRMEAAAPWLRHARDALRDEPGLALQPGGLARLAHGLGVHPVHLARSFRAALGSSPGDYARARRLQLATARLLRGTDSLAEVALAAGYFDQAHFTRAFVARHGQPPARWRRLHRR
jgi:AraC family transcriptional regulator